MLQKSELADFDYDFCSRKKLQISLSDVRDLVQVCPYNYWDSVLAIEYIIFRHDFTCFKFTYSSTQSKFLSRLVVLRVSNYLDPSTHSEFLIF